MSILLQHQKKATMEVLLQHSTRKNIRFPHSASAIWLKRKLPMSWSSFSTLKLFLHSPNWIKTISIEYLEDRCRISCFSYIRLTLKGRLYKRQDSLLKRLLTPTDMSLLRTKEYSLPQLTVSSFPRTSMKTSKSCLMLLQLISLYIWQRQTTIGFSFKNINLKKLS